MDRMLNMDDPHDFVDDAVDAAEFRSALRRFLRTSERAARRAGLTPQRHLLLLMIAGAPDGSQSSTVTDLSERLQLAQSTVTELVQRAEDSGLVERKPAAHERREFRISLTPEGMRRLGLSFGQLAPERRRLQSVLHTQSSRSPN